MLTIEQVSSTPNPVDAGSPLVIRFKILGGLPAGFYFPFSNESLTENRLEFVDEEEVEV